MLLLIEVRHLQGSDELDSTRRRVDFALCYDFCDALVNHIDSLTLGFVVSSFLVDLANLELVGEGVTVLQLDVGHLQAVPCFVTCKESVLAVLLGPTDFDAGHELPLTVKLEVVCLSLIETTVSESVLLFGGMSKCSQE